MEFRAREGHGGQRRKKSTAKNCEKIVKKHQIARKLWGIVRKIAIKKWYKISFSPHSKGSPDHFHEIEGVGGDRAEDGGHPRHYYGVLSLP